MFKKQIVALVFVTLALALIAMACGSKMAIQIVSKPIDFCATPNDGWAACMDFTYKGLRLTWGAEKDDNFIAILNIEDWNMLWNGSAYDRHVRKTFMIQSSLLGDRHYGDCGGWGGVCLKYKSFADTVEP